MAKLSSGYVSKYKYLNMRQTQSILIFALVRGECIYIMWTKTSLIMILPFIVSQFSNLRAA